MASRTEGRPRARRAARSAAAGHLSLLALVVLLDVIGLVMVLSSSSVEALRAYGSSWVFFERQLLWVVIGLAAMAVALRVDYRRWRSLNGPLLAVSVGLPAEVAGRVLGKSSAAASKALERARKKK